MALVREEEEQRERDEWERSRDKSPRFTTAFGKPPPPEIVAKLPRLPDMN